MRDMKSMLWRAWAWPRWQRAWSRAWPQRARARPGGRRWPGRMVLKSFRNFLKPICDFVSMDDCTTFFATIIVRNQFAMTLYRVHTVSFQEIHAPEIGDTYLKKIMPKTSMS